MTNARVTHGKLALHGGSPIRTDNLPYGRQKTDETDVESVVEVLRSDWLTTGPMVAAFEDAFTAVTGAKHAVSISSGTAALHAAMFAIEIGEGDEVIVPTMTFAASANCVVYQGGTPVFADVDPETLLLGPEDVEKKLSPRTKAVIAVDYAGQPCDYDGLRALAKKHNFTLVADACHAVGGAYRGTQVGTMADLSTFSFHPVKHITTAEGGMITTDNADWAERMKQFRNHGITSDHRQREKQGSWFYEMTELGYNYRMSDMQCALGMSQLAKLPGLVARRREISQSYDKIFSELPGVRSLVVRPEAYHAYHLYVVRIDESELGIDREQVFQALRAEGIGVNVHYVPVHLHPFYQERFGTAPGDHPKAEAAYSQILSLPMFPAMTEQDIEDVAAAFYKVCNKANWSGAHS